MRIAEIALSAIIAFAVVYVIYQNDRGNSVLLSSTSNNYTVAINSVPKAMADSLLAIPVTITGERNEKIKFLFRYALPKMRDIEHLYRYGATPLTVVDSVSGLYQANVRIGAKGTLSYYYIEIRDPVGRNFAGLKNTDGQPLTTLAIGQVDSWVKYGYYICLFIAALLVTMGAFGSIRIIAGKAEAESAGKIFLLAALFTIVSVFVLGNLYRLQLIAGGWQGTPWGINVSDNLKQILVIYLIFISLAFRIVKTKSSKMQTIFPKAALEYMGIVSFFVMITALILPLFVGKDYENIPVIFYAFLALLVISYFLVLRRTKHA